MQERRCRRAQHQLSPRDIWLNALMKVSQVLLSSLCLSAGFHKSTSTSESFYVTRLCFSMKPPLQFPFARPGTLPWSALAPLPQAAAFVLVTLKGRAVFQRPADAICKDMRAFLWVRRYEVIVPAAHLAGLSRHSKFDRAAATAGAATCTARTLNYLVTLCRAGFHSSGFGSPAMASKQGSIVPLPYNSTELARPGSRQRHVDTSVHVCTCMYDIRRDVYVDVV